MKKVLLSLSLAAVVLLAFPAPAQPGPGIGGAPQQTPAANPPREPGPGFGFTEEAATPAPAPAATEAPAPAPAAKPSLPPVYDEAADAKADVAAAVAKAKKEKKRVLVTLGGNWCGWCRALDRTFTQDGKVAAELAKAYVPVKVDVGKMTKNLDLAASWGADPKKGVPLIVVLDGKGKAVKVQETDVFEAGKGHDPEKVVAFLKANAGR
jgi:thiol-disulfide isomerase/thioredoxin